jgi:hypothetical protein
MTMSQVLKTNTPPEAGPLALTASFQIEAAPGNEADGASAQGGLPRFRMVAYSGGPMRVAGWRYPVVVDLAGLSIPSQNRPIRFGHDASHGVGHTDSIRVEAGQLVAAGLVSRDTAAAREVVVSSKNGFPWQASIGAAVEEFEFIKENQKTTVNGRGFEGPINVIRKSTLGEISFVDLGADGSTSATVAASVMPTANPQEIQNMEQSTPTIPLSPTSSPPRPRRRQLRLSRRRPPGEIIRKKRGSIGYVPRRLQRRAESPRSASSARRRHREGGTSPRSRPGPSPRGGMPPRPNWRCCAPADPSRRLRQRDRRWVLPSPPPAR